MLQKTEIRREILRIVKDGQNYISNIVSGKEDMDICKSNSEPIPTISDISNFSQGVGSSEKEKNRILENENHRLRAEMGEMRNKLQRNAGLSKQNHQTERRIGRIRTTHS